MEGNIVEREHWKLQIKKNIARIEVAKLGENKKKVKERNGKKLLSTTFVNWISKEREEKGDSFPLITKESEKEKRRMKEREER